jgi:uncharacterized protein (TIGR00369 family)
VSDDDRTKNARSRVVTWDDPKLAIQRSRQMSGVEFFDAVRRGRLPEPPFGRLLGMDMFDSGEGRVMMSLQPQEMHYNPMGCVHGGILATLLDSVMSAAVHTALPPGKGYLTREITISFHRPVFEKTGEIMAEGQIVAIDGPDASAEGRIIAGDGRVYATGTARCAVFDAKPGRRDPGESETDV